MIVLHFLLYYFIILPISFLPFPLLYGLSNFLYFLFYYVLGYRKKIVVTNIRNSFPEKSDKEREDITKKFYRHFSDLIVESLKTFTISKAEVKRRVVCKNPELINKYYNAGRNIIIAGGHLNNWELFAVGVDDLIKHQSVGIYKPLSNKYFNTKMQQTRSKYGLYMLSTKLVNQYFEEKNKELSAVIFAIDQSPSNSTKAYWMKFLNQDTGVLFGMEKYSKEYDYDVLYGRINKEKRGHYSFEFFEIIVNSSQNNYGEITEKATRLLEADIRATPEFWLWTHRRWKHKNPN